MSINLVRLSSLKTHEGAPGQSRSETHFRLCRAYPLKQPRENGPRLIGWGPLA